MKITVIASYKRRSVTVTPSNQNMGRISPAFAMKKDDLKAFLLVTKILRIFFMAPMKLEAKKFKSVSFVALILTSAISVNGIRAVFVDELNTYSRAFIRILNTAESLIVVYCITFLNFIRKKYWAELTTALKLMERITSDWKSCEGNLKLYLKLIAILLSFFPLFVLKLYSLAERGIVNAKLFAALTKFLGLFYMDLVIVFYATITYYLNVKCSQMKRALWDDPKGQTNKVLKSYKTMRQIVDIVNVLFGQLVFLTICILCTEILNSILFSMEVYSAKKNSYFQNLANFLATGRFLIPLLILVMSCNSLDESGKDLVKTCYILREKIDHQRFKEEIVLLAECMEELSPILSAAGFYNINQYCLSSMFTAIITHLVIILQFDVVALNNDDNTTRNNTQVLLKTDSKL